MTIIRLAQIVAFFGLMVLVSLLMYRREQPAQVVPTPTVTLPTFTPIVTETPLPTMTSPPPTPIIIVVTEQSVIVMPAANGNFSGDFFTGTICNNVPVFSQPTPNYNLIIGKLYKGNQVEVTGLSDVWARIIFNMSQVAYIPIQYVTNC